MARLVLGGDVMLARGVGQSLAARPSVPLLDDGLRQLFAGADLSIANLECCITGGPGGEAMDDGFAAAVAVHGRPGSADRFCAPSQAAAAVASMGLSCVSLANNHSLDAGWPGLASTRAQLADAGVLALGVSRRAPDGTCADEVDAAVVLDIAGIQIALVAVCDAAAAGPARPRRDGQGREDGQHRSERFAGPAIVDFQSGCPERLLLEVRRLRSAVDAVVVFPHWGPNFSLEPVLAVRTAAAQLLDAGVDLIVGHSAHVFQAVAGQVVFDAGGLVDDYPPHPLLRTDLGLVCAAELDHRGLQSLELFPVVRSDGTTRLAEGEDHRWARDRLQDAAAALTDPTIDVDGSVDGSGESIAGRRSGQTLLADPLLADSPAAEISRWWR